MNIHACKIFCYLYQHAGAFKVFCYLPSHICIFKVFLLNLHTCILKVFWLPKNHIHAYPRYFCYQKLHTCISKVFCYQKLHTCISKVSLLLPKITYMHIQVFLLPKLHTSWVAFFAISFKFYSYIYHLGVHLMLYTYLLLFAKKNSYYTFMEKVNKNKNLLLIHTLQSHFMSYAPILRSIFGPFSAHTHIGKALGYLSHMYAWFNKCLPLATYSMTNISTSSRRK